MLDQRRRHSFVRETRWNRTFTIAAWEISECLYLILDSHFFLATFGKEYSRRKRKPVYFFINKKERQLSSNIIRTTAGCSFTYRIKHEQVFLGNCSRTDLRRAKLYCQTINGPVTPEIIAWRLPLIAELVNVLYLLEILNYLKRYRYIHKSISARLVAFSVAYLYLIIFFFFRFVEPWFCWANLCLVFLAFSGLLPTTQWCFSDFTQSTGSSEKPQLLIEFVRLGRKWFWLMLSFDKNSHLSRILCFQNPSRKSFPFIYCFDRLFSVLSLNFSFSFQARDAGASSSSPDSFNLVTKQQ